MYQHGAAVRIGEVLAGKYRVDRVLGEGGMGVVVAATHLQLDQLVALKFIRGEALGNAEIVSRFEREARVAVRLKSEHAARIIDVGRLDSGSPYIVMEYLEGQDLAQLLEQRGPLPVAIACDYIIQACDAIAEAHGLGIVHRDLKPGNLFLATTAHGQQAIKVLDFGISKSHGPLGDSSMTRTQAIMGSPGYMSPEQMRSTKNVDGRTDVWSLGVILYELIAGRVPFQADTFSALCVKIAVDPHPPMLALPATLPGGFEAVVNRALEKNPALRYQSAIELAQALAPYAGVQARDRASRMVGGPAALPSAAHPMMLSPGANTLDAAAGARLAAGARGRRTQRWTIAGAGIAVAIALGVGIAATRDGRAPAAGGESHALSAPGPGPTSSGGSSAAGSATSAPPTTATPTTAPTTTQQLPPAPPPATPGAPADAPEITATPRPAEAGAALRDAGVDAPAPAPSAVIKPRPRPATPSVDPYSSPD